MEQAYADHFKKATDGDDEYFKEREQGDSRPAARLIRKSRPPRSDLDVKPTSDDRQPTNDAAREGATTQRPDTLRPDTQRPGTQRSARFADRFGLAQRPPRPEPQQRPRPEPLTVPNLIKDIVETDLVDESEDLDSALARLPAHTGDILSSRYFDINETEPVFGQKPSVSEESDSGREWSTEASDGLGPCLDDISLTSDGQTFKTFEEVTANMSKDQILRMQKQLKESMSRAALEAVQKLSRMRKQTTPASTEVNIEDAERTDENWPPRAGNDVKPVQYSEGASESAQLGFLAEPESGSQPESESQPECKVSPECQGQLDAEGQAFEQQGSFEQSASSSSLSHSLATSMSKPVGRVMEPQLWGNGGILKPSSPKTATKLKRQVTFQISDEDTRKMEWMNEVFDDLEESKSMNQTYKNQLADLRFDFRGRLISPHFNSLAAVVEARTDTSGLRHHGLNPHLPGYTVNELLTLSSATGFPSQQILALRALRNVFRQRTFPHFSIYVPHEDRAFGPYRPGFSGFKAHSLLPLAAVWRPSRISGPESHFRRQFRRTKRKLMFREVPESELTSEAQGECVWKEVSLERGKAGFGFGRRRFDDYLFSSLMIHEKLSFLIVSSKPITVRDAAIEALAALFAPNDAAVYELETLTHTTLTTTPDLIRPIKTRSQLSQPADLTQSQPQLGQEPQVGEAAQVGEGAELSERQPAFFGASLIRSYLQSRRSLLRSDNLEHTTVLGEMSDMSLALRAYVAGNREDATRQGSEMNTSLKDADDSELNHRRRDPLLALFLWSAKNEDTERPAARERPVGGERPTGGERPAGGEKPASGEREDESGLMDLLISCLTSGHPSVLISVLRLIQALALHSRFASQLIMEALRREAAKLLKANSELDGVMEFDAADWNPLRILQEKISEAFKHPKSPWPMEVVGMLQITFWTTLRTLSCMLDLEPHLLLGTLDGSPDYSDCTSPAGLAWFYLSKLEELSSQVQLQDQTTSAQPEPATGQSAPGTGHQFDAEGDVLVDLEGSETMHGDASHRKGSDLSDEDLPMQRAEPATSLPVGILTPMEERGLIEAINWGSYLESHYSVAGLTALATTAEFHRLLDRIVSPPASPETHPSRVQLWKIWIALLKHIITNLSQQVEARQILPFAACLGRRFPEAIRQSSAEGQLEALLVTLEASRLLMSAATAAANGSGIVAPVDGQGDTTDKAPNEASKTAAKDAALNATLRNGPIDMCASPTNLRRWVELVIANLTVPMLRVSEELMSLFESSPHLHELIEAYDLAGAYSEWIVVCESFSVPELPARSSVSNRSIVLPGEVRTLREGVVEEMVDKWDALKRLPVLMNILSAGLDFVGVAKSADSTDVVLAWQVPTDEILRFMTDALGELMDYCGSGHFGTALTASDGRCYQLACPALGPFSRYLCAMKQYHRHAFTRSPSLRVTATFSSSTTCCGTIWEALAFCSTRHDVIRVLQAYQPPPPILAFFLQFLLPLSQGQPAEIGTLTSGPSEGWMEALSKTPNAYLSTNFLTVALGLEAPYILAEGESIAGLGTLYSKIWLEMQLNNLEILAPERALASILKILSSPIPANCQAAIERFLVDLNELLYCLQAHEASQPDGESPKSSTEPRVRLCDGPLAAWVLDRLRPKEASALLESTIPKLMEQVHAAEDDLIALRVVWLWLFGIAGDDFNSTKGIWGDTSFLLIAGRLLRPELQPISDKRVGQSSLEQPGDANWTEDDEWSVLGLPGEVLLRAREVKVGEAVRSAIEAFLKIRACPPDSAPQILANQVLDFFALSDNVPAV